MNGAKHLLNPHASLREHSDLFIDKMDSSAATSTNQVHNTHLIF